MTLEQLAAGFDFFNEPGRYSAFCVFYEHCGSWRDSLLNTNITFGYKSRVRHIELVNDTEVVCVTEQVNRSFVQPILTRSEEPPKSPIFGLLINGATKFDEHGGAMMRRVFCLEFDTIEKKWVPYSGALLRWMKSRLCVEPVQRHLDTFTRAVWKRDNFIKHYGSSGLSLIKGEKP